MQVAEVTSRRGTCMRRRVGAVAMDHRGVILGTGYNGAPRGMPHCSDEPCEGAGFTSGAGLDICEAIHAEVNCIVNCSDIQRIAAFYVTTAPCVSCTKLLLSTGCQLIVYREDYPASGAQRWRQAGRLWMQLKKDKTDEP